VKKWKRVSFFTLRNGGVDFGLKTGSRGTPWNSKNAGPGGSDFTNCRFCPFKWHFGVFEGGSLFHTFFDHFLMLYILSLFVFLHFLFFWFCHFFSFVDFWCFLSFHDFGVFHCFSWFWFIFKFLKGYLKDKTLFWPLFLTVAHSHGKHFGGVDSLCEKWPLFFTEFL